MELKLRTRVYYAAIFMQPISQVLKLESEVVEANIPDYNTDRLREVLNSGVPDYSLGDIEKQFAKRDFDTIITTIDKLVAKHSLAKHRDDLVYLLLASISRLERTFADPKIIQEWKDDVRLLESLRMLLDKSVNDLQLTIKSKARKRTIHVSDHNTVREILKTMLPKIVGQIAFRKKPSAGHQAELRLQGYLKRDRKTYVEICVHSCQELKQYLNFYLPDFAKESKNAYSDQELSFYYDIVKDLFNVDVTTSFPHADYTKEKFIRSFLTNKISYNRKKGEMKKALESP